MVELEPPNRHLSRVTKNRNVVSRVSTVIRQHKNRYSSNKYILWDFSKQPTTVLYWLTQVVIGKGCFGDLCLIHKKLSPDYISVLHKRRPEGNMWFVTLEEAHSSGVVMLCQKENIRVLTQVYNKWKEN